MKIKIGLIAVIEFTGHIGMFAGFNFTFLMAKRIPDGWAAPVAVNGSFNLISCCGRSPNKIRPKSMAVNMERISEWDCLVYQRLEKLRSAQKYEIAP